MPASNSEGMKRFQLTDDENYVEKRPTVLMKLICHRLQS